MLHKSGRVRNVNLAYVPPEIGDKFHRRNRSTWNHNSSYYMQILYKLDSTPNPLPKCIRGTRWKTLQLLSIIYFIIYEINSKTTYYYLCTNLKKWKESRSTNSSHSLKSRMTPKCPQCIYRWRHFLEDHLIQTETTLPLSF